MSLRVAEWFGRDLADTSPEAELLRLTEHCPFIEAHCTKMLSGMRSGVCSVDTGRSGRVCICPNRLYARDYKILRDVAQSAFGERAKVLHPSRYKSVAHDGNHVVAFGKRYGGELRLPTRGNSGSYFVDWVLARIAVDGGLSEFVALEIQTLDTTGSYKAQVEDLKAGNRNPARSQAGLNWENVNKRILPQLIYKGHVLRQEALCTKGLFFVCPTQVYERISTRLGNDIMRYPSYHPGSICFQWYGVEPAPNETAPLDLGGRFVTTIDQLALAFTAPRNLPPSGVYQTVIEGALSKLTDLNSGSLTG